MTNKERRKICLTTKICIYCLDADYIHKPGSQHQDCKNPDPFSCPECREHYLVCTRHPDKNKYNLEKNRKFWTERNKVFTHTVSLSSSKSRPSLNAPQPSSNSSNNVQCDRGLQ